MNIRVALFALALAFTVPLSLTAAAQPTAIQVPAPSDAELVRTLPGFTEGFATVNGVRLHYVAGGSGSPVLLLPGWPQTSG